MIGESTEYLPLYQAPTILEKLKILYIKNIEMSKIFFSLVLFVCLIYTVYSVIIVKKFD